MENIKNNDSLSPASLALFVELAKSAGDWGGQPLFEGSDSERGNLTDLKKKGLVTTFEDRGDSFIIFTEAGTALAADKGISL